MMRRILVAMLAPALALAWAGAAVTPTRGSDGCCCIVNDAGQLVCTITGEVLETCCCKWASATKDPSWCAGVAAPSIP